MKRGGGRRYYRPEDVDLLRGIRRLLYDDGYTIKGVQKILRQQGVRYVMDYTRPSAEPRAESAVREIPDVASEARGAMVSRPHEPSPGGPIGAGDHFATAPLHDEPTLPSRQREQLQAILEELEACRKTLSPDDN